MYLLLYGNTSNDMKAYNRMTLRHYVTILFSCCSKKLWNSMVYVHYLFASRPIASVLQ